jgi:hypothetical protein
MTSVEKAPKGNSEASGWLVNSVSTVMAWGNSMQIFDGRELANDASNQEGSKAKLSAVG